MTKPQISAGIGLNAMRVVALCVLFLGISACTMNGKTNLYEGIGFREARFQEVSAIRDFRQCRDEAFELDKQAQTRGSTGQYLASARLLEKCESQLGPETAGIARDERMRAYALSIQNYIKGGDIDRARENMKRFNAAFPDNDLYYADGSSFIESMEVLLGQVEPWSFGKFAGLNINQTLKSEMRRVRYWKRK